jgi:hypothetical protein
MEEAQGCEGFGELLCLGNFLRYSNLMRYKSFIFDIRRCRRPICSEVLRLKQRSERSTVLCPR